MNLDHLFPPSLVAPRTCLKCGELFVSTGPGNRICPSCGLANIRLGLTERELRQQRGAKRRKGEELLLEIKVDEDDQW